MFSNKRVEALYNIYNKLLNFSNLSWWLIDLEDNPNIFYCNNAMCNAFSLDEKIIQHSIQDTCPIAGDYNKNIALRSSEAAKNIFSQYNQLRLGMIEEYDNTFPYYDSKLDETLYFRSRAKSLEKDQSGKPTVLFGIIEPEIMSTELYQKARTDSLTGVFNRREFDSQLEFLINISNRKKHSISLILCDIDHFKQYNDLLGHFAGDECLINVARAISLACSRRSDIVCRYGGEEFAIIVYGDAKEASLLAESIRKEVYNRSFPHPAKNNDPVTVSVGHHTIIPDNSLQNMKILIESADKALYKAKNLGRNVCVQFQE